MLPDAKRKRFYVEEVEVKMSVDDQVAFYSSFYLVAIEGNYSTSVNVKLVYKLAKQDESIDSTRSEADVED